MEFTNEKPSLFVNSKEHMGDVVKILNQCLLGKNTVIKTINELKD